MSRPKKTNTTSALRSQYWQTHLDKQRQSGLTQKAYCAQAGINYSGFSYWRSRLNKAVQGKSTEPTPLFKEVEMMQPKADQKASSCMMLTFPNRTTCQIPTCLSIEELRNIFQALGGLA